MVDILDITTSSIIIYNCLARSLNYISRTACFSTKPPWFMIYFHSLSVRGQQVHANVNCPETPEAICAGQKNKLFGLCIQQAEALQQAADLQHPGPMVLRIIKLQLTQVCTEDKGRNSILWYQLKWDTLLLHKADNIFPLNVNRVSLGLPEVETLLLFCYQHYHW